LNPFFRFHDSSLLLMRKGWGRGEESQMPERIKRGISVFLRIEWMEVSLQKIKWRKSRNGT
jgi:hypothetical protein